jgi:hypothetical protein
MTTLQVPPFERHRGGVLRPAAWSWAICTALGVIVPAVASPSNLAPMLGLFITGPLGFIAASAWAFSRSEPAQPVRRSEFQLFALWLATLAYTLMLDIAPRAALAGVLAQLLVTVAAMRLDRAAGRQLWVFLAVSAFLVASVLASLYPPTATNPLSGGNGASPLSFVFLLDGRLDARHHVAPLVIRRGLLLGEWGLASIGVALTVLAANRSNGRARRSAAVGF